MNLLKVLMTKSHNEQQFFIDSPICKGLYSMGKIKYKRNHQTCQITRKMCFRTTFILYLNKNVYMWILIQESYNSRPKAHFLCNLTSLMIATLFYFAHGIQILADWRITKKMLSSWDFVMRTFTRA